MFGAGDSVCVPLVPALHVYSLQHETGCCLVFKLRLTAVALETSTWKQRLYIICRGAAAAGRARVGAKELALANRQPVGVRVACPCAGLGDGAQGAMQCCCTSWLTACQVSVASRQQRGLCRPLVPHPRGAGRQGRPAGPLCGSKPIRLPSTLARTAQKQPTHAVHWASVLGAARTVPGGVGDAQMSTPPVRDAVVTVSLTSGGGRAPWTSTK